MCRRWRLGVLLDRWNERGQTCSLDHCINTYRLGTDPNRQDCTASQPGLPQAAKGPGGGVRYPPRYTEVASKGRSLPAQPNTKISLTPACHPTRRAFAPEHMRAVGEPSTAENVAAIILAPCWSPKQDGTCRRLAGSTSPNPQRFGILRLLRMRPPLVASWPAESLLRRRMLNHLLLLLLINCRPTRTSMGLTSKQRPRGPWWPISGVDKSWTGGPGNVRAYRICRARSQDGTGRN